MTRTILLLFIVLLSYPIFGWKVDVYWHTDFRTHLGTLTNDGCKNLDELKWSRPVIDGYGSTNYGVWTEYLNANDQISSINTHGGCVRLYEHNNCLGLSLAVYPGNFYHGDLGLKNFNDKASSIGPCFNDDHRKLQRRWKENYPFFHEIVQVGPIPDLLDSPVPDDDDSPIRQIQRGYRDRVEYVRAEIEPRHLNHGSSTNQITRQYARDMGGPYDDAGHIIAQRLGGTGRYTGNIFPQSRNFNRGIWRSIELQVATEVRRTGWVRFSINLLYDGPRDTRPSSIIYRIENREILDQMNDLYNPTHDELK